jgi:hypothetical protein
LTCFAGLLTVLFLFFMHEEIEKLLVLQSRDRAIKDGREEYVRLEHERTESQNRSTIAEDAQAAADQKAKELEVKKNALESDIQGEQAKIRTYSKQQLETKDNEHYRALSRQIEACQKNISDLETEELMALEEIDAQAEILKQAQAALAEANQDKATALAQIDERETNLNKTIEEMEGLRMEAAGKIDGTTLARYDRLLGKKGANIIVGITHGTCGGCHMKLPSSEVVAVKGGRQIKYCPNCARILYYTRDMTLEEA